MRIVLIVIFVFWCIFVIKLSSSINKKYAELLEKRGENEESLLIEKRKLQRQGFAKSFLGLLVFFFLSLVLVYVNLQLK